MWLYSWDFIFFFFSQVGNFCFIISLFVFSLLVAHMLFHTLNMSTKVWLQNYSPCPLWQQRPTSTSRGRHTAQHSNELGGGRRGRHKHREVRQVKGGRTRGGAAVWASTRGRAESSRGQTEAYGVQFDDGVHLPHAAVRVHVDQDVTCGAREGVGGNAGWGARLRAAVGQDHVAVH